jgi:hypothetical protein|tara:strand:+ start:209 stop:355 length:147 start_codon:yes stop_codon:yes gene_type:complete
MKRKSTKKNIPTLTSMTILFKRRRFKRPKGCAQVYMMGFNDAKKRYKK